MASDSRPLIEAAVDYSEILKTNLSTLSLSGDAVDFLLGIWNLAQVFDDVADGDLVARPDLDRAIWFSGVGMVTNPFFAAHSQSITPVIAAMILKWQASDAAERSGLADVRSYVWRAGYYDLVLIVACLCHGPEVAQQMGPKIMRMYGETFQGYMEEFTHA